MVVSGISNGSITGSAAGTMGMNQASDSVSKDLLRQIDEAQKKMQELSSNNDLTMEEKMKKRQELQKKISDLNSQLRQHQIEMRREATENARKQKAQDSKEEESANSKQKTDSAGKGQQQTAGLSQSSMQAMISADGSMKQAQVQGSVAKKMEGKAGVLEAEIKLDAGRGGSTDAKEEELADVKKRAANATASQMDTLSKLNETVKNVPETDGKTAQTQEKEKEADSKETETKRDSEEKSEEDFGYHVQEERNFVRYTPVDVRL